MPTVLAAALLCILYTADNALLLPELYPPQVREASIPDFYRTLRQEDGTAVLNLPWVDSPAHTYLGDYCYYAAVSGKKAVNQYRHARKLDPRSLKYRFPSSGDMEHVKADYLLELRTADIRHILVHPGFMTDQDRALREIGWLRGFLGEPEIHEEGRLLVYRIPDDGGVSGRRPARQRTSVGSNSPLSDSSPRR